MFSVMLVCLFLSVSLLSNCRVGGSYEWHATVCAPVDLWLVEVDEDSWVAEWASSAVARDNALVSPANGLLVDEIDGCEWSWLTNVLAVIAPYAKFLDPKSDPKSDPPAFRNANSLGFKPNRCVEVSGNVPDQP